MSKDSQQTCEELAQQYRILLEVSESIAAYRDLRALFEKAGKGERGQSSFLLLTSLSLNSILSI
jgi:hypothetical protein